MELQGEPCYLLLTQCLVSETEIALQGPMKLLLQPFQATLFAPFSISYTFPTSFEI